MKKIAYLIAFLALGFTCTSCDEPPVEEIKYVDVTVMTDYKTTIVTEISFFDSNGYFINKEEHAGTYKVPQNGLIQISWENSSHDFFLETIKVGTATSMRIKVHWDGTVTFE